MKKILNLMLLVFLAACNHAPTTQGVKIDGAQRPMDFEIIDAHVHTNFDNKPEETSHIPYTLESFKQELREAHVGKFVSLNTRDGRPHFDFKTAFANDPEFKNTKFIHCYGVSGKPNYKLIEEGIKSHDYSCIKIYLGYVHAYAYDPVYRPLYAIAEKYSVPVVFHTGDTYSKKGKLKFADPLTIDEVAVDFPKVKFVIAHLGNPWVSSAAEVAYKNPNVFVDGSAFLIGKLSNYSEADLQAYVIDPLRWAFGYMEDPHKLMFGSDWPLVSIKDTAEAFKKAIPREHWEKVFKTNAEAVFGL